MATAGTVDVKIVFGSAFDTAATTTTTVSNGTGDTPTWKMWVATDTDASTIGNRDIALKDFTATWSVWVDQFGRVVQDFGDAMENVGRAVTEVSESFKELSERERQRIDTQRRAIRRQAEEREAERKEAVAAAEKILLEHLTTEQADEYRRLESFRVIKDDKIYRIHRGIAGNVELIDDEGIIESYCIHPRVDVPEQDNMLIQKFMIETDEESFRKIANITRRRERVAA